VRMWSWTFLQGAAIRHLRRRLPHRSNCICRSYRSPIALATTAYARHPIPSLPALLARWWGQTMDRS